MMVARKSLTQKTGKGVLPLPADGAALPRTPGTLISADRNFGAPQRGAKKVKLPVTRKFPHIPFAAGIGRQKPPVPAWQTPAAPTPKSKSHVVHPLLGRTSASFAAVKPASLPADTVRLQPASRRHGRPGSGPADPSGLSNRHTNRSLYRE